MTVATRLDIVATAQDRVSAVLRQVNAQLSTTADKLREAKQAGADSPDVEDIFTRARDRRMKAAAEERRQIVLTARAEKEATAAKAASNNILTRTAGGIEQVTKSQEALNKILGVAGFVGIVGSAVVGLGALIAQLFDYDDAIDTAKENQQAFNDLLDITSNKAFDFKIERSDAITQGILKAQREKNALQKEYFELQEKAFAAEAAVALATDKRTWHIAELARLEKEGTLSTSTRIEYEARLSEYTRTIAQQSELAARARADEVEYAIRLDKLYYESEPVIANLVAGAKGVSDWFESSVTHVSKLTTEIGKAFDKVKWNPFEVDEEERKRARKKAEKDAEREAERRKQEAVAHAQKVRDLQRDLALAKATTDVERARVEREYLRSQLLAGNISKREYELKLQIEQANHEQEMAEFHRRIAEKNAEAKKRNEEEARKEQDRQMTLRDEIALLGAKNEQERITLKLRQELAQIQQSLAREEVSPEVAALEARKARAEAEKEISALQTEQRVNDIEKTGKALQAGVGQVAEYETRLSGLNTAVGDMTKLFSLFEEGQASTQDMVMGTIGAFGAIAAGFGANKKEQALILGAFHQIEALASLAYLDFAGFARHQAVAVAAFAFAGKGGGKKGGGGSGGSSKGTAGAGSGASASSQTMGDRREVIMVAFPNGVVYGMGSEVAKAGEQAATSLDGTGMQRRRF